MGTADQKYRTLLHLAPDPIFLVDGHTGSIREVNEQSATLLGYEQDELVGMEVADIHPTENAAAYEQLFETTLTEGTVRRDTLPNGDRITCLTRDRRSVPVEIHSQAIEIDEETLIYTIARDVSERVEMTEQLESQRDLLDVLNQVVRHDLRNDLQVVGTYADLLEERTDEGATEYLRTIQECTRNAVEFTSTAGDLAEVIRNPDQEHQRIQVTELLEKQCTEMEEMHPDASVQCTNVPPGVEVNATAMLGSVFRNLLQNAIEHNDGGRPEVTVTGRLEDGTIEISIADNGPGIPETQQDEIFAKGERGLESTGTGIGLYLADTLVDGYGGTIEVTDNEPRGAVFTVCLPTAT